MPEIHGHVNFPHPLMQNRFCTLRDYDSYISAEFSE